MRGLPADASPPNPLRTLPGACIVEALALLPPCGDGSTAVQSTVDVPRRGLFRVSFAPFRQTVRGWRSRWFWIARAAERVDPAAALNPPADRVRQARSGSA
jgi:hypothetical protein